VTTTAPAKNIDENFTTATTGWCYPPPNDCDFVFKGNQQDCTYQGSQQLRVEVLVLPGGKYTTKLHPRIRCRFLT